MRGATGKGVRRPYDGITCGAVLRHIGSRDDTCPTKSLENPYWTRIPARSVIST